MSTGTYQSTDIGTQHQRMTPRVYCVISYDYCYDVMITSVIM